jgi:hypothetical protein
MGCGVHELADDTAAQIVAIELARSIREEFPELVGQKLQRFDQR